MWAVLIWTPQGLAVASLSHSQEVAQQYRAALGKGFVKFLPNVEL